MLVRWPRHRASSSTRTAARSSAPVRRRRARRSRASRSSCRSTTSRRAARGSIRRLHDHLERELPVHLARSSSPTTRAPTGRRGSPRALAGDLPGVEFLRLDGEGPRPRAARRLVASDAEVLCYMDVDLSTDLRGAAAARRAAGLRPQRRRDRHAPGARRARRARRQARAHLARLQPPAARRSCARASPTPSAASRRSAATSRARAAARRCATRAGSSTPSCSCSPSASGLRIHEVPVDWVDDPDSRVDDRAAPRSTTCAASPGCSPTAASRASWRSGVLHRRLRAALPAAARPARRRRGERARARAHRASPTRRPTGASPSACAVAAASCAST